VAIALAAVDAGAEAEGVTEASADWARRKDGVAIISKVAIAAA
jgi:hypothetical protein